MTNQNQVKIFKEYLTSTGMPSWEANNELRVHCMINNCDADSKGKEAHLYVSLETGQFHCKKCLESGNIITLAQKLNDKGEGYLWHVVQGEKKRKNSRFELEVEKNHKNLPDNVREYLNDIRGWSNEIINERKIGWVHQWEANWIGFPIEDESGQYGYYKLREFYPQGDRKITSSVGNEAQIYNWKTLRSSVESIVICEGEGDCLLLLSKGIVSVTSTHGAGTFKFEWLQYFPKDKIYYIAYDTDKAGVEGAEKVASMLYAHGVKKLFIINLPKRVNTPEHPDEEEKKVDITDYFTELNGNSDDLFQKYAKPYPEKINASEFKEITTQDICDILEPVIKKDDALKVMTVLGMILTYTEECQINIFYNAPSSTGKSHCPLAIVAFFPPVDAIILASCSPTAFFHEQGKYDKEKNEIIVDLSRKIIIFTDMPDTSLLARLRSILSHDAKKSYAKITDKNQKGGNRTKTVVIIGYPSVFFCSAGFRVDEQESTRFIMLSPSIENEKLLQGIQQVIQKESDREKYLSLIASDPRRALFMKRILAIKQENIADIKIEHTELVESLFLPDKSSIKPRQQRDIKKIISLAKGFALINLWFRKREGDYIWATEKDIRDAFALWESVSRGQEYGLAPYIYDIYTKIILSLWKGASDGFGEFSSTEPVEDSKKDSISRKAILKKHLEVYKRPLSMATLRQHILPQLEQVGLIMQEKSLTDGREMMVIPLETEISDDEII